jgi:hypothetical protein
MRKEKHVVFDDIVTGTTAATPAHSNSVFDNHLGKFDRFRFECVVDNLLGMTKLDVFVETSPDGEHWVHANGTPDNPPVAGQGDVHFSGTLPTPPLLGFGDSGANPLFAFARFQIFLGAATEGAHVKITVTPRDSR